MGAFKKSYFQKPFFFIFFIISFFFLFALSSYACVTNSDCNAKYGPGVWICVNGGCIAQCNVQAGTYCHLLPDCAGGVPAGGWCPSTELCCKAGSTSPCLSPDSCMSQSQCSNINGTDLGTMDCTSGTCCAPLHSTINNSSQAFPTKPICLGVNVPCLAGSADPNGIYCCPGLSCQYAGNTQEGGQPHNGPIAYQYQCMAPPAAINDSSCNGTSCDTAIGPVDTTGAGITKALFSVLLSISGALAVLLIIISGYRMMVSQGNPEKLQAAREQLIAAIVGLLFIIFSLVILQTIGVDLLGLSGFSP